MLRVSKSFSQALCVLKQLQSEILKSWAFRRIGGLKLAPRTKWNKSTQHPPNSLRGGSASKAPLVPSKPPSLARPKPTPRHRSQTQTWRHCSRLKRNQAVCGQTKPNKLWKSLSTRAPKCFEIICMNRSVIGPGGTALWNKIEVEPVCF